MSEGLVPQGNALELIFKDGAVFLQVSQLITKVSQEVQPC